MGLLPGVLWSLDIVPATAYLLGALTGGMLHAIRLIVRRMRVMSWSVTWKACVLGFSHNLY